MRRREPLVLIFVGSWASLALAAGPAVSAALDGRSAAVRLVAAVGCWAVWGVVLAASLVPTTVSLTVVRLLAPVAPVVVGVAAFGGAGGVGLVLASAVAVASAVLAFSAELGHRFVQGSAYGDETRFPLRPPGALVLALPVGWAVAASGVIAGALLVAAGRFVAGVPVTVAAVAWSVLFGRRCHRLSRRFLVFVPAGFVVHDHVGLLDTALFQSAQLARFRLAPVGSDAADLTAGALGDAVEFTLRDSATVVLADPTRPGGRAIHLRAGLVSPSRPGRVLAEAARRGHPVG